MAEVTDWSPIDDNNNSAPPVGWPEGQVPSSVNNCARAMQGALKREHDRITAGTLVLPYVPTAGGTITGNLAVNGAGGIALGATQLQNITNGLQVYNAGGGQIATRGPTAGLLFGDRDQTSPDWYMAPTAGVIGLGKSGTGTLITVNGSGNMAVSGSVNASLYGIDNLPVIDSGGGNILIYDATGSLTFKLGSDNDYWANTHTFRNNAGAVGGLISCWDLTSAGTINGNLINASGGMSVGGTLTAANLTATSTVTGAYLTSTGDVHANNAVTAPSMTATGTIQANYLNSTGSANVAGNLTIGNDCKATYFYVNNKFFASNDGGQTIIYDNAGQGALFLQGTGSYYRNGSHTFQLENAATVMTIDAAGNLNVPAGSCTISGNCTAANFYGNFSGGGSTSINTGTITTANLSASSNVTASGTVTGNSMVCGSGVFQNTGPSNLIGQTSFGPSGSWARIDAVASYNVTGAWQTFSDRAVKEAITPYTAGLDAINQLEPVSYTYTSEIEQIPVTRYGLVAQDVAPIVPEMVGEGVTPGGTTMATLNGGHATWLLINAVKELSAKVAALEAQLAAA